MKTVVEIGAHRGDETYKFLQDDEAQVFAFEPDQHLFPALFIASKVNPRLYVLPFAVDIGDNQEPLFHMENGRSSLQYEQGRQFTMTWTIRLDTFMKLYSIDHIDYLRIDAPYREEMCMESLGSRLKDVHAGRIKQYGGLSDITTWLKDHGFVVNVDSTSDNLLEPNIVFWRE